jgi:UV DNA damage endonuclease
MTCPSGGSSVARILRVHRNKVEIASRKSMVKKKAAETWFVYLLRCRDGSLYTGITKDLRRRCEQHNAGTASRYTRSRLPIRLVYREAYASRSLALKREAVIKAMTRREKMAMIRMRTKAG